MKNKFFIALMAGTLILVNTNSVYANDTVETESDYELNQGGAFDPSRPAGDFWVPKTNDAFNPPIDKGDEDTDINEGGDFWVPKTDDEFNPPVDTEEDEKDYELNQGGAYDPTRPAGDFWVPKTNDAFNPPIEKAEDTNEPEETETEENATIDEANIEVKTTSTKTNKFLKSTNSINTAISFISSLLK